MCWLITKEDPSGNFPPLSYLLSYTAREFAVALLPTSTFLTRSVYKEPLKGAPETKSLRRWSRFVSPRRAGGRARASGPKGREPGTPASAASGARAAPGSLEPPGHAPRRPGSNLQPRRRGGAEIRADSNFKRDVRAWPSRCRVPAARRWAFPPPPAHRARKWPRRGGERPPPRSEPTARGAVRKARPWGALPHPPVGVFAVSRRAARWPLPIPRPGDPERIREGTNAEDTHTSA